MRQCLWVPPPHYRNFSCETQFAEGMFGNMIATYRNYSLLLFVPVGHTSLNRIEFEASRLSDRYTRSWSNSICMAFACIPTSNECMSEHPNATPTIKATPASRRSASSDCPTCPTSPEGRPPSPEGRLHLDLEAWPVQIHPGIPPEVSWSMLINAT